MEKIDYPKDWPDDSLTKTICWRGTPIIAHPDRAPHMLCGGEWLEINQDLGAGE